MLGAAESKQEFRREEVGDRPEQRIFSAENIGDKISSSLDLEMENLGHSEKKIFNKHFRGANSELNSLYFPRKTP